jgi:hypothetical protein
MSTKVSQTIRQRAVLTATAVAVLSMSSPARAGLFGHSKQWKAAQAAAQQQALDQQQAEATAQQQAWDQQQAQARAQQLAQQQAAQAQQQAFEAQQRAAAQQYQPSPTYQQQAPQISYATETNSGVMVVGDPNAQQGQVDKNGVPLFGQDGKPLSDKDKALYPFRHQQPQVMPVMITQPSWTPVIEDQFSAFVAKFGAGVKARPMHLLNFYMHDANTNQFVNSNPDPAGVYYYSDCADLPYFLRSYFAYKMGLPMAIAADAVMNMQPFASQSAAGYDTWSATHPDRTDVSPYGNTLTRRAASNIPPRPGAEKNFINYWSTLMDVGSTRTFMVSPFTPNYNLSDVYPVKIDRSGIRPGTLIHSDGHMLIVTSIHSNGDIELIDAHPDNSLQFKTLDPSKLMRDRPDRAYGFFRFRPAQAVGGQWITGSNGQPALYGAKIVTATDQELYAAGVWSVEQWMGPGANIAPGQPVDPTQWKKGFAQVGFFDFLRAQMSSNVESADDASGDLLNSLCNDLKQRVADVDAAGTLPSQARPQELPLNIYNADATWEAYATPSRDGRTRQAIINLPGLITQNYRNGIRNLYKLSYSGSAAQYQQTIAAKWAHLDATCKVTYKNSVGMPVTIGFSALVQRAPRMSFDYADCPEKRWGAPDDEIARTCKDQDPGNRWFKAEQVMRNAGGKTNDNGTLVVRSDRPITLEMLEGGQFVDQADSSPINLGLSRSLQPNVKAYLWSPQFVQDLSR